jgi:trehalose 6-phosphate synthase
VTPLRDGMNLVAKEYIAAQNAADPGVLILSRFAGAAEDMTDALIVNPFDAEEIAEAMHQGLAMPLDERQARHKSLLARIKASSAKQFCLTFLAALRSDSAPAAVPQAEPEAGGARRAAAARMQRSANHVAPHRTVMAMANGGLPHI